MFQSVNVLVAVWAVVSFKCVCVKTRKGRHRPGGRKLPTSGTTLRLVALLKRSSGGRALFMTLNVNMNVENSIKNIYICLLIRQLFRSLP